MQYKCVDFEYLFRHVIIATRNKAAGEQTVKEIIAATKNPNVEQMTIDLASLDSIRTFASEYKKKKLPPLYSLVNNAGLQFVSKTELTKDGYEATFGVNHLGGFLLSHLLLPHFSKEGGMVIQEYD
jgi:NAD(P)-dependent dehydrogenase (short-subunit alcohol dehydrogenase family)